MANISETSPASKPGVFNKLPRLSTAVWLIIIGGLFVIAMVPLTVNLLNESAQQYILKTRLAQLLTQHEDLKSRLASQTQLTNEINANKKELQALRTNYKKTDQNPEISQAFVALAWDNDITVTSMSIARAAGKIGNTDFPVFTYTLALSGQVPGFQNLLIQAGKRFPTCQITNVSIMPAQVEGELDKATIIIQIFCDRDT
jgi:hypothetical protein